MSRRGTRVLLHGDPIPPPPKPASPPESTGRIVLLITGKFGALAPRNERGRRKILGAHGTITAAQEAILTHLKEEQ